MSRVLRKNYMGAFLMLLFALFLNVSAFAATGKYEADVKIPVRITLDGEKASSEKVTVTLTPIDGADDFDQNTLTVDAKKGETVEAAFTKTFTEPVSFKYEIRQVAGETDAYIYDETVYTAVVFVENDYDNKGLKASVVKVYKDDDTTKKQEAAEFVNVYKNTDSDKTSSNGGGSSSGSSGGSSGSGSGNGSSDSSSDGSVLGAVRDAFDESPAGQVLGAARDAVENSPVGRVLGAARGAVKTGDNSFMMVSALCCITAVAVFAGWIMAFVKRRTK
ncbi:hypothetical protein [Oribacterium sp. WCC10]|uniref:hypothetical protein n=1 Tax=Oribacterium sp. WCC10 TaxID=1855343 RepID=UPI0008E1D0E0|nr:hypothetical protein [Oribacterium sp. WCC10]SFG08027.1 pilin isopeptide linkage domain-containing protein [Oribacterium sp. WCC10]